MATDLNKTENVKLNKELASAFNKMSKQQQEKVKAIFKDRYNGKWEWDVDAKFDEEWTKITTEGYDISWDAQAYTSFNSAMKNTESSYYDYIIMLEESISSVVMTDIKDEDVTAAQDDKPEWQKEQDAKRKIKSNLDDEMLNFYETFKYDPSTYMDYSSEGNGSLAVTDKKDSKDIYGNNLFFLTTNDTQAGEVILCGVLKEIPEFGVSTSWDSGPGKSLSEWVSNFIKDDVLESIQFFGSQANEDGEEQFTHLCFSDAWTGMVYENTEMKTLDLTFRTYSNEKIGNMRMTSAADWIKYLTAFTPINSEQNLNVKNVFDSLNKTHDAGVTVMKNVLEPIKNGDKNAGFERTILKMDAQFDAQLSKTFGPNRVYGDLNTRTKLGAKLFNLHIFPYLFKTAFPVCITNWTCTPSKEMMLINGEYYHIYYDFNITCEFDQVPSRETILSMLF